MKKLFLILTLCFCAAPFTAAEIFADDYVFQKQIIINDSYSCQAVRIHPDWLLTAGHCVVPFIYNSSCTIRLIMAQGRGAEASVVEDCGQVFVSTEMNKDKQIKLSWDIALIRFPLHENEYEFHDAQGESLSVDEFNVVLQQDPSLRSQWRTRNSKVFPQLYLYGGNEGKFLQNPLLVPLWWKGTLTYLTSPQRVAYLGKQHALWVTVGFGVTNGNSGGAVLAMRPNGKSVLIGIVSAKEENQNFLSDEVKQYIPDFAQAKEFFIFTGFSQKTTANFIKKTLARFHDQVSMKKISRVLDPQNPNIETEKIRVK